MGSNYYLKRLIETLIVINSISALFIKRISRNIYQLNIYDFHLHNIKNNKIKKESFLPSSHYSNNNKMNDIVVNNNNYEKSDKYKSLWDDQLGIWKGEKALSASFEELVNNSDSIFFQSIYSSVENEKFIYIFGYGDSKL